MILDRTQTFGIFAFKTEGTQEGDPDITAKFIEAVQAEQHGIALIELGTTADVLKEVRKTALTWDPERKNDEHVPRRHDLEWIQLVVH
ncbi:MAG: hypothetical protein IPN19_07210 [Elusimicrobia bacterium]|nr:hypothetical protein [Elusimicrobiota bacterium]